MAGLKRRGLFLSICLTLPLLAGACTSANKPPVANAGPDQTVNVGDEVILNGIQSYDPEGKPLSYAWSFDFRPSGSAAQLQNATSVHCSFTADVAGDYVVRLTVSDGVASDSDTVTIRAGSGTGGTPENDPPIADAGDDLEAAVGQPVTLDGSGSTDPDGDPLTYLWDISSQPAGSVAVLTGAGTVNPSFTPDVAGDYVVELTVSDGEFVDTDSVTVTATLAEIATFDFTLVDAAYSRTLDRIIMVEHHPVRTRTIIKEEFFLHIYDPAAKIDVPVRLEMRPNCLAISPDGLYAAVGHDARVSYIDLAAAFTTPNNCVDYFEQCPINVVEIMLPGDGYIYAFPELKSDRVMVIELTSGNKIAEIELEPISQIVLRPTAPGTAFAVDGSQLFEYSVGMGTITELDKYAPDDVLGYAPGNNLWFSSDGDRLITQSAKIYWWEPEGSLNYHGSLDLCTGLVSVDHHLIDLSTEVYAIVPAAPEDLEVVVYGYDFHEVKEIINLPDVTYSGATGKWPGRLVFFNAAGDRIYVLAAPSTNDACAVITLNTP